jgi:hypothetical protein
VARQKRHHNSAACVNVVASRPGIDDYPSAGWRPQNGPISLAYVEKM